MRSPAATAEEYLGELPEDPRTVIEPVRRVILERPPAGYVEARRYGMIAYKIPLSVYPMGKSCVRFQRLDDLPLEVIGDAVARDHVLGISRGLERFPIDRSGLCRVGLAPVIVARPERRRQYESVLRTSPPRRVPRAWYTPRSMLSLRNFTEPSANR